MQIFIAVLFLITQAGKKPKCPLVGKCVSKLINLYYGMLFSNKKEATVDTRVT